MDLSRFDNRKLRRRDFQFSLARLLVAMTVFAVLLSFQLPLFLEGAGWFLLALLLLFILFNDWSAWHVIQGNVALNRGDYRRAILAYTRAIKADPDEPHRYYLRAMASSNLGDLEAAINDYTKAIKLHSGYAPAWIGRADVRRAREEYQEAIDDVSIGLCVLPPDPDMRSFRAMGLAIRGLCYLGLGRIEDADEELDEAFRLAPDSWEPYAWRASARLHARDYPQALSDLDEAIARGANSFETFVDRAAVLFNLGHYDAAFQQIRACLAGRPRAVRAICTYAWFLATCPEDRLRDGELALRLAETARALGADRYWLCEGSLAAACAELGRFDEAVEHAEKARQLAPPVLRQDVEKPLAAYRQGEPYRDRG